MIDFVYFCCFAVVVSNAWLQYFSVQQADNIPCFFTNSSEHCWFVWQNLLSIDHSVHLCFPQAIIRDWSSGNQTRHKFWTDSNIYWYRFTASIFWARSDCCEYGCDACPTILLFFQHWIAGWSPWVQIALWSVCAQWLSLHCIRTNQTQNAGSTCILAPKKVYVCSRSTPYS